MKIGTINISMSKCFLLQNFNKHLIIKKRESETFVCRASRFETQSRLQS